MKKIKQRYTEKMVTRSSSEQRKNDKNESKLESLTSLTQNEDLQQNLFFSQDKKWCYQISIIDYLQTFDNNKKLEVLAKKVFKNADTKKLSAVNSEIYGDRFIKFMKNCVF